MGNLQDILRRVFSQRPVYVALAWTLVIVVAQVTLFAAWHSFDNPYAGTNRNDYNGGHATIDFGAQYLMGRMLVEGHSRDLYNRSRQRVVLTATYPVQDQDPKAARSDAENLMYWMMGSDEPGAPEAFGSFLTPLAARDAPGAVAYLAAGRHAWTERQVRPGTPEACASCLAPLAASDGPAAAVYLAAVRQAWAEGPLDHARARRVGGPLYPPVNAFFDAPLALLPARTAYHVQQVINVLLAFLAGLGIVVLSRWRVWWPIASLVILLFPGFMGSINLGQNATLTLTILVWGWVLIARARPGWGGLVWGLLAFKPVWAMVFFLVLVLTRRWRDCLAMLAAGAVLGLLTLPFVGFHSWLDWLQVGREAAQLYDTDRNWVFLSRDVLSIPRRWLLVFEGGAGQELVRRPDPNGPSCWWYYLCGGADVPGWLVPTLAGWGLLVALLETTVRPAALRPGQARAVTGPPAAFLLLGAWLCCYHFMYYDVLLAALPVLLVFAEPRSYIEPLYLTNKRLGPLGGAGAAARWEHPDREETGRLGVVLLGLLAVLCVEGVLALGLGLAVARWRLPWQLLLMLAPLVVPVLVALACVGAVFVARVARPLVPPPEFRSVGVLNRVFPSLLVLLLLTQPLFPVLGLGGYFGPPWDTFVLMAMWLWAGWHWLRVRPSSEAHEESPPVEKAEAARLALSAG
jgi:hypothetical protein